MIGLSRGSVQVVPYHFAWPELFEREAVRLRGFLGPAIGQIEHVGSTAVPGLSAKPVIDMLVAVPSLSAAHTLIAPLERLGYEHRPEFPALPRLFFALGPHACRTHYLSLAEVGSSAWHNQTAFRDHLRSYPDAAAAYSALKHELALQFASDRPAYTVAKADFIQSIVSLRRSLA